MNKKGIALFFLVIILLLIFGYYKKTKIDEDSFIKQEGKIIRVIDGDTLNILIKNKTEKVRLRGINAPEKNEFMFDKAKNFLSGYVFKNVKLVYLENEAKDKYNRILGYVFYNDEFINKEILKKGFAHVYYYNKNKYTDELIDAEEIARKNNLGIWEKSQDKCAGCINLESLNTGENEEDCEAGSESLILKNICNFTCNLENWKIKDESSSHLFVFPNSSFLLPESFIIVYNGIGKNSKNIFYFGNPGCARIWNNDHDSFFLRDAEGKLVLFERYSY